jgi:hypothetical protein
MPAKQILQQPVELAHVQQVSYIVYATGGIDFNYSYTPVDATGTAVGEKRALGGTKTGPTAQEIRDWITTKVLPELNTHEGT